MESHSRCPSRAAALVRERSSTHPCCRACPGCGLPSSTVVAMSAARVSTRASGLPHVSVRMNSIAVMSQTWFSSFRVHRENDRRYALLHFERLLAGGCSASSPRSTRLLTEHRGAVPPRRCSSHHATPFPHAGCACRRSSHPRARARRHLRRGPHHRDELLRHRVNADTLARNAAGNLLHLVGGIGHENRQVGALFLCQPFDRGPRRRFSASLFAAA